MDVYGVIDVQNMAYAEENGCAKGIGVQIKNIIFFIHQIILALLDLRKGGMCKRTGVQRECLCTIRT